MLVRSIAYEINNPTNHDLREISTQILMAQGSKYGTPLKEGERSEEGVRFQE